MNTLSLIERTVPAKQTRRTLFGTREVDTDVAYLEFAVDGVPLRTSVTQWVGFDIGHLVFRLTEGRPEAAVQLLDQLRGKYLLGERADVIVCGCSAIGCGSVGADLVFEHGRVVWSGLAYDHPSNLHRMGAGQPARAPVYRFDREQYLTVLDEALERYLYLALRSK